MDDGLRFSSIPYRYSALAGGHVESGDFAVDDAADADEAENDSGLGFFLGGNPQRFGHNGSNLGFDAVTVAFCETGEGAVILMNANTDIEVLKNILIEAIGTQYHWPGYFDRHAPNETMQPDAGGLTYPIPGE